ncbi:hypothetical protein C2E21_4538 [Chlorella sorokiniana]|uniref:Uncharacterized protein n=1 Tax=Chlorella sorokiniana TaxID=3076 RepID=A0A2P6TQR4_CHLSO|nr:hypothetical protein C2E21_4538 [Chlorella sorokiniana]|eukprot:PRW56405.1 hypothetical protein C2E21_4538 [Chlorella sorokiniana]
MEWQLSFAAAGSFVEHLSSPHLSCSCGYDAAAREDGLVAGQRCSGGGGASSSSITTSSSSNDSGGCGSSITTSSSSAPGGAPAYFQPAGVCWSSDDGGCPRLLQLDDAEAQLLCMWVRTGLWVLPNISSQLKIARASAKEAAACAAAASTSTSSSLREDEEASCSSSGSSGAASEQLGPSVWLKLKLRGGGKLTALVEVLESDWRPLSLRLCLAGEHEVWRFSDWHQWQPGLWLAGGAVQSTTGEGGVVNDYSLAAVQVSSVGSSGAAGSGSTDGGSGTNSSSSRRFVQPPAPLLPPCSSFVPGLPEEVPAWHTSSGHSLVRPLLNGRDVGYFILDTGASGFVLDPSTGDALGLEAFGELQVTSIVGRIASRYRRADTFQLGPLRMARPLLMELPMAGLVTGVPDGGRVVGIVGYDVLRRAVVHVPAPPRRPPPPAAVASAPLELVTAEGRRHRGLFMVDSGAGGLDIVLNARAAQALGLGKGSTATHIKGLGGGGGARMTAQRCQLGEVWLGPHCFTSVQALYREGPGGNGGLELSQHTSGIVCGGVLGRCTLVFDYPRLRLAVRRPAAPEAAAVAAAAG